MKAHARSVRAEQWFALGITRKHEERGTQNAEAYELYLKGRHEQYYCTKESYLRALDLYEEAAKLDPKFARAYIGVASVCCVFHRRNFPISWHNFNSLGLISK